MTSQEVFPPGSHIQFINAGREELIDENLPVGTISQICIYDDFSVKYNIVWWDGNDRKSEWVSDNEFVLKNNKEKIKIGFKS